MSCNLNHRIQHTRFRDRFCAWSVEVGYGQWLPMRCEKIIVRVCGISDLYEPNLRAKTMESIITQWCERFMKITLFNLFGI